MERQSKKEPAKELNRDEYELRKPKYERLAANLAAAVGTFLEENRISVLDVSSRIKQFDSMEEKTQRKKYTEPWEQIEDVCGLRIICYYPTDIAQICDVLRREFDIHSEEDASGRLGPKEFGYRSTHLIVSLPSAWAAAPNYRGLDGLRVEIQVRTVLMHAWAVEFH